MAVDKKLDLVLVSGNSDNPVCKIMNYGKHKFEQAKREKESKKKQKTVESKEIRFFNMFIFPQENGIFFSLRCMENFSVCI